jgi:polysaccharide chain length determinant protein (PEP-CTERM system associated)
MQDAIDRIVEQLRSAWRYRWWAVAAAWAVALLGWAAVMAIPAKYEASARVYIDATSKLRPLLQGLAVEQNVDAQLNFVRQSLLSGPQLQKVAQKTDLDLAVRDRPKAREKLVDGLREDIRIDLDRGPTGPDGRPESANRLYTIAYANSDPQKSLAVVNTLLNSFVEDTLGGNRTGAEGAQTFLRAQIKEYEGRLAQAEERLANFKKDNVGLMPRESGDFFGRMQAEIDAIQRAQAQLRTLAGQRDAAVRAMNGQSAVLPSGGGPVRSSDGTLLTNDIDSRLQEAQAQLDQATLRYTDKHPQVIALRETVAELEQRRKEEIAALRSGGAGSGRLSVAANPVYQNMQIKLNDIDLQMAATRGEIADRQRRIDDFRKMMNVAPDVEAELQRLNRDYGITKAQYEALVDRLEKARLSNEAEETGTVRFEVIEPPSVKAEPVSPNRPLLVALVFAVSVGVGVGVALLLAQLRRVVTSTRGLSELTGLPVVASVTAIVDDRQKRTERLAVRRLAMAGGALVAAFALVLLVPAGIGSQLLTSL